jgi:hypothetical protein
VRIINNPEIKGIPEKERKEGAFTTTPHAISDLGVRGAGGDTRLVTGNIGGDMTLIGRAKEIIEKIKASS